MVKNVFEDALMKEQEKLTIRENRLNRLKTIGAPQILIDNEMRLINESKQNIAVLSGGF